MLKNVLRQAGWLGMIILLGNYIFLSLDIISGQSLWFHLGQLGGSALIFLSAWVDRSYPAAALNAVFAVIALATLARLW